MTSVNKVQPYIHASPAAKNTAFLKLQKTTLLFQSIAPSKPCHTWMPHLFSWFRGREWRILTKKRELSWRTTKKVLFRCRKGWMQSHYSIIIMEIQLILQMAWIWVLSNLTFSLDIPTHIRRFMFFCTIFLFEFFALLILFFLNGPWELITIHIRGQKAYFRH